MTFQFGGIDPQQIQQMQQAYQECQSHLECKDCPLIHGNPLQINESQLICETGINKEYANG